MVTRFQLGKAIAVIVLLLLGLVRAVAAQQKGSITGRVVEENTSRPLTGAQVVVEGLQLGVLAGADGRYTIPSVPAGAPTVRLEIIGFATATQTVDVTAGGTATLDFAVRETGRQLDKQAAESGVSTLVRLAPSTRQEGGA